MNVVITQAVGQEVMRITEDGAVFMRSARGRLVQVPLEPGEVTRMAAAGAVSSLPAAIAVLAEVIVRLTGADAS